MGLAGVFLMGLFLLNSFSRTNEALQTVRWLSPFAYYDATDAPPVRTPSTNPLLRTAGLVSLYEQRAGLATWLLGVTLLAALFVSLAKQVVDLMLGTDGLRPILEAMTRAGANAHEAFLGFAWFGPLQLLLALFVVTQVGRWAAEDTDGRLEMVLSTPTPRWRIVVERAVALVVACSLIATLGAAATALTSASLGVALSASGLASAAFALVPLCLSFGAIGALMTGWAPRMAVPVLTTFAVASYFLQQLDQLFKLPEWTLTVSPFQLYGAPLASGVNWPGLWGLLGITAVGFALAIRAMRTREIGR